MRDSGWDMLSSPCVQSGSSVGVRSLGGGYEPTHIMEARSPAPANTWHHNINNVQVKQEPMDHDSSAYGSGSDGFHSSSPTGSDHSRDSIPPIIPSYSSAHLNNNIAISQYYTTPIANRMSIPSISYLSQPLTTAFNPLTPPSLEPISPKIQPSNELNYRDNSSNATLTPCTTPPSEVTPPKSPKNNPLSETEDGENFYGIKPDGEDHLRRLQMAFEKNGMLPSSPRESDNRDSAEEDGKSDYEMDEVDEQGLRVPRVNSHGKIKTFKCKQCEFVAVTKLDFWEHSRGHIKVDKLLTCPKCPFVTEYKHHLEYHLRNHFGSKPFKCDKCSYSCVNKSMLNSHLKSHSNVYQYRCSDCTYATKYCHSLKLHLRKYKHNPAMVLNPDGSPNPLPIIDVYGTRRGPKQRLSKSNEPESPSINSPPTNLPTHSIFPPFMLQTSQPSGMPLPFPYPFLGALGNPLLFPGMNPGQISPGSNERSSPDSFKLDESPESVEPQPTEEEKEYTPKEESSALDLSKPEISLPITVPEIPVQTQLQTSIQTPVVPMNPAKNRRKGRAFKLERISVAKDDSSDEDITEDKQDKKGEIPVAKVEKEPVKTNEPDKKSDIYNCQYCDIAFRDVVMYTMHMGYHGYKDPFTCNMCGEQSVDKVSFFLHIARTSHS